MTPEADSREQLVRRWVRPAILGLQSYHVPSSAEMIKLDAMENPYPWPEDLRAEWAARLAAVNVNRYPDPEASGLKQRLRTVLGIPAGAQIMLGNGSDELLQMVMLALARPGSKLLVPEPGFSMYRIIAELVGMEYVGVALREADFGLDLAAMLAALETHLPALLILCYPNNPTANLFPPADMVRLIEAAPGLVLIDEAYFHFAQTSLIDLTVQYPHVVVLRTLSKIGLAGLRLGVLSGPAHWLEQFEKLRLPYNINSLSQASASYMLERVSLLETQAAQICQARSEMFAELQSIGAKVEVWPSATNFLLLRIPGAGHAIGRALADRGILVKNLHGAHPLLRDCLRVTIGLPSENSAFVNKLRHLLQ